jgi:putative polyketide hydroxylase
MKPCVIFSNRYEAKREISAHAKGVGFGEANGTMSALSSTAIDQTLKAPVLVVGGGPVGMMTALLLARSGVKCILVERRAGLSAHPKGRGFNSRSMELFRQCGMLPDMLAAQPSRESVANVAQGLSLTDPELKIVPFQGTSDLVKAVSPAPNIVGGQDIVEMVLSAHLNRYGAVQTIFDCEIIEISQNAEGVKAVGRRSNGALIAFDAEYVVAADGARSPCRALCGRTMAPHSPVLGQNVNILFRADLSAYLGRFETCGFLTIPPGRNVPGLRAILAIMSTVRSVDERTFNIVLRPDENPADITMGTAAEWMRRELDLPQDFAIEIISISPWDAHAQLIDRFRDGRVLFAGDAARTITPAGALGMNTGLIDANNLAWRLSTVVRGHGGRRLLEDYHDERYAHSQDIVSASVDNLRGVLAGHRPNTPPPGDASAPPRDGPPPNRSQMGLYLGFTYASGSVLPDGTAFPSVDDPRNNYSQSATPGARAPHIWLDPRYDSSTIDLFGGGFCLLTANGALWQPAVDQIRFTIGLPLRLCDIGLIARTPEICSEWMRLYGVSKDGAVLVRPDGMVAWRAAEAPDNPDAALSRALTLILDRSEADDTAQTNTTAALMGTLND